MSEIWYYEANNGAQGPMSVSDLVFALSGMSSPMRVPVWRVGFGEWKDAGDVPEVVRLLKPPPLTKPRSPPPPVVHSEPIFGQPVPAAEPAAIQSSGARDADLTGIGGWLVLVALGQILAPLKLIASLVQYYSSLDFSLIERFPLAFAGEAALNALLFGLLVYMAVLFFQHSRRFPTFFIIVWIAAVLSFPVNTFWVAISLSLYTGQPANDFFTQVDGKEIGQTIGVLLWGGIWVTYILKSRRVANTFVR
jgi:hypothetical protein